MLAYMSGLADAARTFSPAVTAYRTALISGDEAPVGALPTFVAPAKPPALVLGGIVARTRRLLQKARASAGYTPAIGYDLGLTVVTFGSGEPAPDPDVRPAVDGGKAAHLPGVGVSIPWPKGRYDGVSVLGQRGESGDVWDPLGDDLYSPFIDKRPSLKPGQPETRRYRFQYKEGNEAVGQLSDIVVVTVPG